MYRETVSESIIPPVPEIGARAMAATLPAALVEGQERIHGILFEGCGGQVGEVGAVRIGEHGCVMTA